MPAFQQQCDMASLIYNVLPMDVRIDWRGRRESDARRSEHIGNNIGNRMEEPLEMMSIRLHDERPTVGKTKPRVEHTNTARVRQSHKGSTLALRRYGYLSPI